jgi:histidine ammonia-lyase
VDVSGRYDGLCRAGKATYDAVRALVGTLDHDRYMADDIETIAEAVSQGTFSTAIAHTDIELR